MVIHYVRTFTENLWTLRNNVSHSKHRQVNIEYGHNSDAAHNAVEEDKNEYMIAVANVDDNVLFKH
eukprot:2507406-Ditylum_brightwellii.AAC.1